jgi:hypothetical protein
MKLLRSLSFALTCLLFAGCATTSPKDAQLRAIGVQTFGTDAYLKIEWIPFAGPISDALSNLGTSDELDAAAAMKPGVSQRLDLIVWSESSSKAASTLLRALRYPGLRQLPQLRLLFIGDAQDAERVRPAIEAAGATFYFHQG